MMDLFSNLNASLTCFGRTFKRIEIKKIVTYTHPFLDPTGFGYFPEDFDTNLVALGIVPSLPEDFGTIW
jgi:hypothetical protein